jgi:hypothetical protein
MRLRMAGNRLASRCDSARALNVASFNSLSGFDHHDGTKPQRMGTRVRLPSVATMVSMGRRYVVSRAAVNDPGCVKTRGV